jgi:hypothetical protein
MNRAEQYREHAKECLGFSTSITDPAWRAQLVSIAAQWRELANRECEIARKQQGASVTDLADGSITVRIGATTLPRASGSLAATVLPQHDPKAAERTRNAGGKLSVRRQLQPIGTSSEIRPCGPMPDC